MPGMSSIFDKIGQALGSKPKTAAPAKPAVPGEKKPFDINLYFKAVGMYYSDLFKKKIPYFFQNIGSVFAELPVWWNNQPQDEQISHALMVLGVVVCVAGVVMFFVM